MSDERLRDALRSLPTLPPSRDFTDRVLARLDAGAPGAPAPPPAPTRQLAVSRPSGRRLAPGWLGAVAAALLVVLAWGWSAGRQAVREQRRADLRRESAALRRELASLRAEATRPQPALYVGGNEQVDVVLDVGALPVAAAIPLRQERRELHQEPTN